MIQQTSRLAFKEIKHKFQDRQRIVYDKLKECGNMTNSEIADALNMRINSITPRVFELRKMGYVREVGKRSCRITGRTAMAWEITINTLF